MSSPNANWTPGTIINSPVGKMLTLDPDNMKVIDRYKLLIGSIIPRPIAFVSTESSSGLKNLAPFSFFNCISSNPPCIVFSVSRKPDGTKKDTLINIEETGQFVVNSSNAWFAEALVHTAATYPYGVDEMEKVGLTPIPSQKIKPPRVKEAAIQFECETYKTVEVGDGSAGSATLVIGKIVLFHIHEKAYKDGKIDHKELQAFARLGGISYTTIESTFDLAVPNIDAL